MSYPYTHTPVGSVMPRCLTVRAAGYSITGIHHLTNQDRCLADESRNVFMVADGMGGNRAGERAAQMAIELLPYHPTLLDCEHTDGETVRQLIREAFLDVNQEDHYRRQSRFPTLRHGYHSSISPAGARPAVYCQPRRQSALTCCATVICTNTRSTTIWPRHW